MSLRRSARIAAQAQQVPIVEEQPVVQQKAKAKSKPKTQTEVKPQYSEKDPYPSFVTVQWIQELRAKIAEIQTDLFTPTTKHRMEEANIMVEEFHKVHPTHSGIDEWFFNAYGHYQQMMNHMINHEYFSRFENNYPQWIRENLKWSLDTLQRMENEIDPSSESKERSYFYPEEVYTKERKNRTNQMVARLNAFFERCRAFGIATYGNLDEENATNRAIQQGKYDNFIFIADEERENLKEGPLIFALDGKLTPEKRQNVLSFSKEFTDWNGEAENKYNSVRFHIRLDKI